MAPRRLHLLLLLGSWSELFVCSWMVWFSCQQLMVSLRPELPWWHLAGRRHAWYQRQCSNSPYKLCQCITVSFRSIVFSCTCCMSSMNTYCVEKYQHPILFLLLSFIPLWSEDPQPTHVKLSSLLQSAAAPSISSSCYPLPSILFPLVPKC